MGRYSRGGPYGSIFRLVDNRAIVSPHSCPGRPVQDVPISHVLHLSFMNQISIFRAPIVSTHSCPGKPVQDVTMSHVPHLSFMNQMSIFRAPIVSTHSCPGKAVQDVTMSHVPHLLFRELLLFWRSLLYFPLRQSEHCIRQSIVLNTFLLGQARTGLLF